MKKEIVRFFLKMKIITLMAHHHWWAESLKMIGSIKSIKNRLFTHNNNQIICKIHY